MEVTTLKTKFVGFARQPSWIERHLGAARCKMFRSVSMNLGAAVLPGCQAILCFINIVLQLVSLPPSYWGTFVAQTNQGAILERGHFGLWYVCSERVPFFFEDCEAPITYLRLTGLSTAAGALAIIHLLVLFGALPLIIIRVVQSVRNIEDGCLDVRFLCLAKTTVTVIACESTCPLTLCIVLSD
ncbi:hypothetical protein HPB50_016325 [Hyalomma asiaticum]|uniref:Uncharacterized protein n=1 Tax=Hyalomma asiaticum TaxID=266040 RepID=A0ACB7RRD1_HYAAI|nr:hypothetical protein HPB50_016325 [Hyalomma asiaticum]